MQETLFSPGSLTNFLLYFVWMKLLHLHKRTANTDKRHRHQKNEEKHLASLILNTRKFVAYKSPQSCVIYPVLNHYLQQPCNNVSISLRGRDKQQLLYILRNIIQQLDNSFCHTVFIRTKLYEAAQLHCAWSFFCHHFQLVQSDLRCRRHGMNLSTHKTMSCEFNACFFLTLFAFCFLPSLVPL